MFGNNNNKKKIGLGIIIGENTNKFLSFDEYAEHFLLPFSPRFCNIDFAVSTLTTADVKNIVVLTKRDKEILLNYLVKGWPHYEFQVFDYIDIRDKFVEFLNEYSREHPVDHLAIIKGNYPVWFDMKPLEKEIEKSNNIVVKSTNMRTNYPALIVEKKIFIKKCEDILLDEANLDIDMIHKMMGSFHAQQVTVTDGYILPFQSLKEYYDIHMNMISGYLEMDAFNARVPIRGDSSLNVYSSFGKHSHVINSIVGENVDIQGKIENSVIFSNVRVAKDAVVKNSIIFPGNHIGGKSEITSSIIDEFSGDNTTPNIGPHAVIVSNTAAKKNQKFPSILNFGVSLVGKDARIPSGTNIGGNCYIDSFVPEAEIKTDRKISDGTSVLLPK
jgi:ADP-glucose pyrophosphorylase